MNCHKIQLVQQFVDLHIVSNFGICSIDFLLILVNTDTSDIYVEKIPVTYDTLPKNLQEMFCLFL